MFALHYELSGILNGVREPRDVSMLPGWMPGLPLLSEDLANLVSEQASIGSWAEKRKRLFNFDVTASVVNVVSDI